MIDCCISHPNDRVSHRQRNVSLLDLAQPPTDYLNLTEETDNACLGEMISLTSRFLARFYIAIFVVMFSIVWNSY